MVSLSDFHTSIEFYSKYSYAVQFRNPLCIAFYWFLIWSLSCLPPTNYKLFKDGILFSLFYIFIKEVWDIKQILKW